MTGCPDVELSRWATAFPGCLVSDVLVAVSAMPSGRAAGPWGLFHPDSIDSDRHPVGITVLGDAVEIPSRYYGDELRPSDAPAWLSPRQRTLLACMFSRHHIGYVRQRWARELVRSTEPWVVPFVVQLLGGYVVEIVVDLQEGLSELDDLQSSAARVYRRVLQENPGFVHLTAQRAASYWDCYYRRPYPDRDQYPAFQLLHRFQKLVRNEASNDTPA